MKSDRLLGWDKLHHLTLSFALFLWAEFALRGYEFIPGRMAVSLGIVAIIGALKEIYDATHGGHWSWLDMLANWTGIFIAGLYVLAQPLG